MKIGTFGAFMHDRIRTVSGDVFESLGGTLYNIAALAATTEPTDTILPFTYLSEEHLRQLESGFFARFPRIDASNLRINPAGTDRNDLVYVTPSSRRECMTVTTPQYDEAFIAPAAQCDAVLVNFLTGTEMTLPVFRKLRKFVKGIVYFDLHNLGKLRKDGIPVPGHRFNDWEQWLRNVDIVQANEWEVERLLDVHPKTEREFRDCALRFLQAEGPSIVNITLGGAGCAMAWREAGRMRFVRIPAMDDVPIVDTTGCGDCFSSGFLAEYLRTKDPLRSALFAAAMSGLNCRVKGLDALTRITGVREAMHAAYDEFLRKIAGGWRGEDAGVAG
ncbi:MAG TPA: PfkB family carbohydrate kinase [Candidatus Sumerlaeota bacterium]|nr:PfkB family carbohydrate kinase [Candidatus Sumerlaeota bacterium]